jgi:hypothetical protein
MAYTRYRAIVKVMCSVCQSNAVAKRKIDTDCRNCRFLRYNNVNRLKKFTRFLYSNFPNWSYFNVYEYVKGEKGRYLGSFQKGKNEPTSDTL